MKSVECGCKVTEFCWAEGGGLNAIIKPCTLHAAAPDLLEACKIALAESERADKHFKCVSPATVALRAAIAKATGKEE